MRFLIIMGMAAAMMQTIMKHVALMVGTVVDLMSIHNGAQNVNVLKD